MSQNDKKQGNKKKMLGGFVPAEIYWAFKEMAAIRKESMTEALTNAILMYIDVEEEKTQE